jgi:tRNA nucleotidyltransferase (CCA-adding enzyme)
MSDYNFLMESRLSPAQFQVLNSLSRIAHAEQLNLYLVGGAVRGMTFGQAAIRNLDFAVEGEVLKILRRLPVGSSVRKAPAKPVQIWDQGSTEVLSVQIDQRRKAAKLLFANGVRAEIVQCRRETFVAPGRPPLIAPAMIFEDLKRRDFAFNAMAISLHPNSRGLLLDPKNGVSDIERGEIRVLHPRSFLEDPVRIYRLFRLGLRLGFKPEEKTARWLDAALADRAWASLSPDNQARELEAVLHEENPDRVLRLYAQRGILSGLDQHLTKIPYDQFRKIHSVSRKIPGADPYLLNFDCLVSKLRGAQKKRLAQKILGDPKTIKLALNLESAARSVARALASSKCATPSQAFKLLSGQPEPLLLFLLAYYPQPKVQGRVMNYLVKVPEVRARLPRQDLLALGVKAGPNFEKILERIFFDQLDGKLKTHQQVEKEMRALAGIKEPPKPPKTAPKPAKAAAAQVKGQGRPRKAARAAATRQRTKKR